jgi:hypothetical protein
MDHDTSGYVAKFVKIIFWMIAQFEYITKSLRQTLLGSDYRVGSNFSMVDFICYNDQITSL